MLGRLTERGRQPINVEEEELRGACRVLTILKPSVAEISWPDRQNRTREKSCPMRVWIDAVSDNRRDADCPCLRYCARIEVFSSIR